MKWSNLGVDGFGRVLQHLGVQQIFLEFSERQAEDVARGDTVIRYNAERQTSLKGDLPLSAHGNLTQIAHRQADGGGAEVVDMVMDGVGLDARQIGEDDGAMEGRSLDDRLGAPVMLIQPFDEISRYAQQTRHGAQKVGKLIGRVCVVLLAILLNIFRDDVVDRVDGSVWRELHLAGRTDAVDLAAL